MRALSYLPFAIALVGAQACAAADGPPPPFKTGPQTAGQASTDNGVSDPGSGELGREPPPLEPEPGSALEPATCSVTFMKNILPKITDQWRCGASQCHGNPTVNSPVMDPKNAAATYSLLTTSVHMGKKLVDKTSASPTDSALYCLMQGTCGQRMPRQGVDPLDLALVAAWLKCKAPLGS